MDTHRISTEIERYTETLTAVNLTHQRIYLMSWCTQIPTGIISITILEIKEEEDCDDRHIWRSKTIINPD